MSELKLPRLVSDGMVLQRNTDIKIWGWAAAGKIVTLEFMGKFFNTTTDVDGKWIIVLSNLKAGGPYSMEISSDNSSITVKNILVGEVWLCSGQSNMELHMDRVRDKYKDEIDQCENTEVRVFDVSMKYNFNFPEEDYETGCWESINPDSILKFSAAGYFYAKALYEKYHVPLGLITASLGGSPAEAWLSEETLRSFPIYLEKAIKFKDDEFVSNLIKRDAVVSEEWYNHIDNLDRGLSSENLKWYAPGYDDSDWSTMTIPGCFEDAGLKDFNGAVWFRKEVEVPASMTYKPARLFMGTIVDSDTAYINGIVVGNTEYQYPPRKYELASDILKAGKNIITLRVICNNGHGRFTLDKPYELRTEGETIDLKGEWKYKVGAVTEVLPETTFVQWAPLGLFNGMIAPAVNYTIKGVIWYQGESNDSRPWDYEKLFSALIKDWRKQWAQGDFPFLYVQLPNFGEASKEPCESNWAEIRDAQLKTLAVPNTAMIVAIDIGEWNDLHPLNKKDIGYRLALAAQKVAYGEDIVSSGPIYKSMKIKDNKIIITFDSIGSGLVIKHGDKLRHFAVAGTDNKFVWAKAEIEDDKVVVFNESVSEPAAVRYAWTDNPEGANLYNREGLPASPFEIHKSID